MKGTEKIIAHILSDAKAQADAILSQAQESCDSIRVDYEQQAKQAYSQRIREGVKQNQDKLDSIERLSQMEARKALLSLKQDMVAQSFDRACDILSNLPREPYIAFLAKLAANASVTGKEEIILNERDRNEIGTAVIEAANAALNGASLTLSDTVGQFMGGLILKRGNIEANCTSELLVDLCRGEMATKLSELLFN